MGTESLHPVSGPASPLGSTDVLPGLGNTFAPSEFVLEITASVAWEIGALVADRAPESGGMLGGPRYGNRITKFVFDAAGSTTPATYAPDISSLQALLDGAWEMDGIWFRGFVHSHPPGYDRLSPEDLRYIGRLLALNPDMEFFAAPIVLPDRQQIIPWVVLRNSPHTPVRARLVII